MTIILADRANRALRVLLAVTAVWTLAGAVPGYLDPAASFERFTGTAAESPLMLELYRGAWGQTFLFAIGYAIASFDPRRHALVVALGAVGKLLYAARILTGFSGDAPTNFALLAALGDLVFVMLLAGGYLKAWPRRGPRLLEVTTEPHLT